MSDVDDLVDEAPAPTRSKKAPSIRTESVRTEAVR